MSRLGELFARFRASRDRAALEKAEEWQRETKAERRASDEDYEGRKDDVHAEEYLPRVNDEP
jgi:hypothetical protein